MGTDEDVSNYRSRLRPRKRKMIHNTDGLGQDWLEKEDMKEWARFNLSQPPPDFRSPERFALANQISEDMIELRANKRKLKGKMVN